MLLKKILQGKTCNKNKSNKLRKSNGQDLAIRAGGQRVGNSFK